MPTASPHKPVETPEELISVLEEQIEFEKAAGQRDREIMDRQRKRHWFLQIVMPLAYVFSKPGSDQPAKSNS